MTRRAVTTAAAVLALLVGVAGIVVAVGGGGTGDDPDGIQVVLSPHPDDELQGWARIAPADGLYTVFVLVTRGEATGNCDGMPGLEESLGERRPEPPPQGRGTPTCAAARVDSWHAFLDAAAEPVGGERLGDLAAVPLDLPAAPAARAWIGDRGARVDLGLPDGEVRAEQVVETVRALLRRPPAGWPDLPRERLVATSYSNDAPEAGENADGSGDPRALEYEHPDHRAVNEAAQELAPELEDGSWIVTHPWDAGAVALAMSRRDYAAMMGMGPRTPAGRERRGAHQVAYGWLAFPGDYWTRGERAAADSGVLFPRVQYYRQVR